MKLLLTPADARPCTILLYDTVRVDVPEHNRKKEASPSRTLAGSQPGRFAKLVHSLISCLRSLAAGLILVDALFTRSFSLAGRLQLVRPHYDNWTAAHGVGASNED